MSLVKQTNIKIECIDECTLAASLYSPEQTVKGAVLIAPATGIKRQFYQKFATFLAQHGYGVLSFDNRGIGESLIGNIRQSEASLQCWGEKDMTAALEQLKRSFPDVKYHLVGHSAGGQLVGLMPNASDLTSMYNFACSSGQLRNMRLGYRVKAIFFMNIFIPLSNAIFGHTKSQWLGMGEPLPRAVANEWQTWCNGSGYVKSAFGKTIFKHHYNELSIDSVWLNAIDDDIANNLNVADMLSVFPQLKAEKITLDPKEHNLKEIGHMKFFSQKSEKLWQHVLDWLAKY